MNDNSKLLKQINEIRKTGNFATIKNRIGKERLREFIHSIYPKFSITEIETITGIPDSTLQFWFEKLNIPFIRNHISNVVFPGRLNSQIVICKGATTKKVSTIKITPELAYIIGFTLGDGSVQKYMIEVFNKDKGLRKHLLELLEPYGTITEEERSNGLWRLRLSNGKIANLIKDEKGIRRDTLTYIFNDDRLAKKFIAAFWDAEGSVLYQKEKKYYNLYLYNSNEKILKKIKSYLKERNIRFSIHSRKTRDKNYFLNGHNIKSKKTLHRINIHKVSWPIWLSEIGIHLNHSRKRAVVKEIANLYGGNKK